MKNAFDWFKFRILLFCVRVSEWMRYGYSWCVFLLLSKALKSYWFKPSSAAGYPKKFRNHLQKYQNHFVFFHLFFSIDRNMFIWPKQNNKTTTNDTQKETGLRIVKGYTRKMSKIDYTSMQTKGNTFQMDYFVRMETFFYIYKITNRFDRAKSVFFL